MQNAHEIIFKIACEELPHKRMVLGNAESIMYRGFKISKEGGKYYWQDTRYNNYYEPVDPHITANILKEGFLKTLTEVRIYNDQEKVYQIEQEILEIERSIGYWIGKSYENWDAFKNQKTGILSNLKITPQQIEHKLTVLNKKYLQKKNLYMKKRGVLKEERARLKTEKTFYLSQIQIYKNQNYGN